MAKMEEKCECSIWKLVVGVALLAVGVFAFVTGLAMQWKTPIVGSVSWNPTVLWYFGGLLLAAFGKIMKMQACGCCPKHCMVSMYK